ncbi:MAG: hypothetical protein V1494_03320 [Candidatus Diapherotrites archaeon]
MLMEIIACPELKQLDSKKLFEELLDLEFLGEAEYDACSSLTGKDWFNTINWGKCPNELKQGMQGLLDWLMGTGSISHYKENEKMIAAFEKKFKLRQ